jgi:aquaporin related protein
MVSEKNRLTPLAPLGFGLILFVVMMMSVAYTGGAIK